MSPVPASVQPHLQSHATALKAFADGLENGASLRQLASALFQAAAALTEAGKALIAEAIVSRCPHRQENRRG